jgi:hypothetical protein
LHFCCLQLTVALVVVAHVSGGRNWVISNHAFQNEVPDHLRERVFAIDMMIVTLAISVRVLLVGLRVDHVTPRIPFEICGGLTLVYGLVWRPPVASCGPRRNPCPALA